MDNKALFKIQYGLFVLSSQGAKGDNGCIVNTVMQITDNPLDIVIGLNKKNYSHQNIMANNKICLSVLTQDVPFAIIKQFGFQSGKDVDKFADITVAKASNGLLYLPTYSNAYISGTVIESYDFDTHTLFKVLVEDAQVLSDVTSVTYEYYQKHIKQTATTSITKGWRCNICGYVHPFETIPEDFICPWCKHGIIDFTKI